MTPPSLNKNSSAVKRIMSEARELQNDDSTEYSAGPLEQDIFEWHCTIRGPADTEFEGGLYHCRIILPSEYPFKAPSVMVLTPNGRFELNKKICISFTSYHEELWQPAWGVRTAIIGLQGFFPLKGEAAVGVGAIEYPIAERKRLATLSQSWTCPDCGQSNIELLPDAPVNVASTSSSPSFQASAPENAGASSHPSLAQAHIPGSIPPLVKPTHEVAVADTPSVLNGMRPSSAFVDPVPDVVTRPILPVAPVATPLQLRDVTEEAEGSGARTPRAAEILSESRTPTPRPSPRPSEQALPAPRPVVGTAIARSTTRLRPPIWLDGAIAFFCFLIAYVAGRRVSHIWELVTEHV